MNDSTLVPARDTDAGPVAAGRTMDGSADPGEAGGTSRPGSADLQATPRAETGAAGPGGPADVIDLSVVVPLYNEEDAFPLLVARLRPVLDAMTAHGRPVRYEVVAVDDGSRDGTVALAQQARQTWPELRLVRLMRNSGHQAALTAGLTRARGAWSVTIDADLQDPPELIPVMLDAALERGVDVVYGVRDDRSTDTRLKRWTAEAFYRLMRRLAGPQVPHNAADFRLMSRRAMDAVNDLPEYGRVYRLAVPWLGFPSTEVTYARAARSAGETKYPMRAMLRLAFDSVTSFSAAPLRLATWLGGLGLLTCLLIGGYVLGALVLGTAVPGWASLTVVITFLGACQLLSMGLLGEYVGRLFEAGQRRPTFLVAYDSHAEETRRVAG